MKILKEIGCGRAEILTIFHAKHVERKEFFSEYDTAPIGSRLPGFSSQIMASYTTVEMFKKKNSSSKFPPTKMKLLHCLEFRDKIAIDAGSFPRRTEFIAILLRKPKPAVA